MDSIKSRFAAICPTTEGWCTVEKANKLIDIVNDVTPFLTVELGVFCGKSLVALAMASKAKNPSSKCIGIDSWTKTVSIEGTNDKANDDWWAKLDYDWIYRYASNLMRQEGVDSIVELWKSKSSEAASKFDINSIDILHQDSNHSEEISCSEVELYWDKVKPNGIWIFDDTNWATTQKAQTLLVSKGYSEIVTETNRCWTVYRRSNY